jgi:hypothetical protein
MRILLADPKGDSVRGAWFSPDSIDIGAMISAGSLLVTFSEDATSSAGAEELYNLTPPPSFVGPVMIWGHIDPGGELQLFLARWARLVVAGNCIAANGCRPR